MGACAQIAVFTYAVMRRRPRYEIRLAAFFADNLMNGVAHCGEQPINVERPLRHIYELGACSQITVFTFDVMRLIAENCQQMWSVLCDTFMN